jgi:hypothetical protein
MALAKTVTKEFPSGDELALRLVLEDDGVEKINQVFREPFVRKDASLFETKKRLGAKMQKAIDRYKTSLSNFNDPRYETARSQIDDGLEL